MNLSVSIPEKLWTKAKIVYPELGTSELIQKALSEMLEKEEVSNKQLRAFWDKMR